MGDVIAGADEEEATDEVLGKVLDELGLENTTMVNSASPANAQPAVIGTSADPAVQARINALHK